MRRCTWLATALLAAVGSAWAGTFEQLAAFPEVRDIAMSPDGRHVAVVAPFEDQQSLHLLAVDDREQRRVLRFRPGHTVANVTWVDDKRVVFQKALQIAALETPMLTAEYFSASVDSKRQRLVFGGRHALLEYSGFGHARQVFVVDEVPGSFFAQFLPWRGGDDTGLELWRVNARTARQQLVASVDSNQGTLFLDRQQQPRVLYGIDAKLEPIARYRATADAKWQPFPRELVGRGLVPRFFDADGKLYALISDAGEPGALYRVDLEHGQRQRLAGRSDAEIADVIRSGRNGPPAAVLYDAGVPVVDLLDGADPDFAAMFKALLAKFPGQLVHPLQFSRDDQRVLLQVDSDRDPPVWYVFDRGTQRLMPVAAAYPGLRGQSFAPTRAVRLRTDDGLELQALLTLPAGIAKPSLVVIPHGGPHGPYDRWRFDAETQLLAQAGHAVLRVNYRGSGGRGERFLRAGFGEWAGRIQDDIAAAVRHVVAEKLVDGSRVCIFGGSFGAYSALMNAIRNPDLYRCAIGYAGVYDLNLMHIVGDIPEAKSSRNYLDLAVGNDVLKLARDSVTSHVKRLDAKLLLIHGSADQRTPIEQFHVLTRALDQAGKLHEDLVVEHEGHGFYKQANREHMYRQLLQFLDASLSTAPP